MIPLGAGTWRVIAWLATLECLLQTQASLPTTQQVGATFRCVSSGTPYAESNAKAANHSAAWTVLAARRVRFAAAAVMAAGDGLSNYYKQGYSKKWKVPPFVLIII